MIFPIADSWLIPMGWFFTAYLGLNTLGNLNSKSPKERRIMTPLSLTALGCALLVMVQA